MYQPLADKIRPRELDEMVGQEHIIGEGGILRRILARGEVPNMIFYGPSGVGKTTLAQIIAGKTHRRLVKLNATTASTADIREVTGQVDTLLAPEGVLLYLDEIQYFTKKQQQSLLEFIESGKITLIASTTENPFFYVYNAILSRSQGSAPGLSAVRPGKQAENSAGRRGGGLHRRGLRRRRAQGPQRGRAPLFRRTRGRRRAPGLPGRRKGHHAKILLPL